MEKQKRLKMQMAQEKSEVRTAIVDMAIIGNVSCPRKHVVTRASILVGVGLNENEIRSDYVAKIVIDRKRTGTGMLTFSLVGIVVEYFVT